jgi:hypothetical protein
MIICTPESQIINLVTYKPFTVDMSAGEGGEPGT